MKGVIETIDGQGKKHLQQYNSTSELNELITNAIINEDVKLITIIKA